MFLTKAHGSRDPRPPVTAPFYLREAESDCPARQLHWLLHPDFRSLALALSALALASPIQQSTQPHMQGIDVHHHTSFRFQFLSTKHPFGFSGPLLYPALPPRHRRGSCPHFVNRVQTTHHVLHSSLLRTQKSVTAHGPKEAPERREKREVEAPASPLVPSA